jgi:Subtilase family
MPFTTGLAAVLTLLGVLGFAPAIATAATPAGHDNNARDQEWWLADLHVTQAWPQSQGSGIVVAVLGTGVDASYPGLSGSVISGPDYTGSGRAPGSPYWGVQGTAVAGLIAAHSPAPGLVGVAPAAKILSVRVTLEFNDPLAQDRAISRRLPQAIADGIRYATDHGARIIDLPLDPGTLGLTSHGDPAAAGGSPAERDAVSYALSKGVLLVAPAGDDGEGGRIVNYPAAYPGVIVVGAVDRTGQLAPFSSRRSYTSLTAPGASLVTAAPPDSFGMISSTSTASGLVAGVAALVLSRYPHLTVAQVTQALTESTVAGASGGGLPPLPARSATGAGYGTVNAIRAMDMADIIATASQPRQPSPVATPRKPARHATATVAAARRPAASTLAGSVLRAAVATAGGLIVLLVIALVVVRSRRERGRGPAGDRARMPGQHENRKPDRGARPATGFGAAGGVRADPANLARSAQARTAQARSAQARSAQARSAQAAWPGPANEAAWASPAGWQGGAVGAIGAPDAPPRPVVAPVPKSSPGARADRAGDRMGGAPGPPWAPAPPPKRLLGPLPVASAGSPPPEPRRGIRVPRDMPAHPGATTEPEPPVSFDLTTPPADFDLSAPAFGLTPPAFEAGPPASEAAPSDADPGPPAADPQARNEALPTRQSLGFAAAPVPADHVVPPAGRAPEDAQGRAAAAGPSYIWDLAATDVFPPASDGTVPPDDAPPPGRG